MRLFQKGFALIEVFIVLAIVGILAAVVVSAQQRMNAKAAAIPAQARVVDQPGLLSQSAKANIERMSYEFEQQTGNQVVLVIVNELGGDTIESYAINLAKSWGIGQKGKNNGVLFLCSLKEKKLRIEVGYGLEHMLPDAKAKRIISDIAPALKAGRWDEGFSRGMGAIISSIRK